MRSCGARLGPHRTVIVVQTVLRAAIGPTAVVAAVPGGLHVFSWRADIAAAGEDVTPDNAKFVTVSKQYCQRMLALWIVIEPRAVLP